MKKFFAAAIVGCLFIGLSGCVIVRDQKPDEVSTTTTRQTTVGVPATTTVERTTVY